MAVTFGKGACYVYSLNVPVKAAVPIEGAGRPAMPIPVIPLQLVEQIVIVVRSGLCLFLHTTGNFVTPQPSP